MSDRKLELATQFVALTSEGKSVTDAVQKMVGTVQKMFGSDVPFGLDMQKLSMNVLARVRTESAKAYAEKFSEQELEELITTFRTPVMVNYTMHAPALAAETMEASMRIGVEEAEKMMGDVSLSDIVNGFMKKGPAKTGFVH